MKILLFALMFIFIGCQTDTYLLSSYLEDTKSLFLIEGDLETKGDINSPLHYKELAEILIDLTHESLDYLYTLECFDESMYLKNEVVSKDQALKINQKVYEDLFQKEYYETTFDLGNITSVDANEKLNAIKPGIYEQNGDFYEVDENGNVQNYDIKDIELESTFSPNLQQSIILPEDSETTIDDTSFHLASGLTPLTSRYFKFAIKDYSVSGRVTEDSLQIKVSKKTESGYKIENELSLNDLKCTIDLSLEEKEFYFRADYQLKDTLAISKSKTVKEDHVTLESFEKIKQKISNITNQSPVVDDELHLLSFQFEVPSTAHLINVSLDLSLRLMANGEAKITLSTTQNQGTQTFQDSINHLNQQRWEVKPYIDGSLECASVLGFGFNLGKVHLADFSLQGGIGAGATSKIHFVDVKKKVIETTSQTIDPITIEHLLETYDKLGNRYIDFCADVNVYYFARVVANQKSSLLRKLGLYGSMTPLKNNISLLHIENHQVVDACTKGEILYDPQIEIDAFDISNYQLYLTVGKRVQLTSSKNACEYSSTNPAIVTVSSDGIITALKTGYATIIVKDEEGVERHCLVFVQEETAVSSFFCNYS